MGIEAEFKQVSAHLLEKLKQYPDFIELFFDAKYLADSIFWQELSINPDDAEDVEWFHAFSNIATENLEKLKKEKSEKFEILKADIPLILAEGKEKYLNIHKHWDKIHFVLTGNDDYVSPSFLIGENNEDHLPIIHAVFGGSEIDYDTDYGRLRYMNVDEVKQVASALSNFSYPQIQARLKLKGWRQDSFDWLFDDIYIKLVKYYQDAAYKGNALLLYLT